MSDYILMETKLTIWFDRLPTEIIFDIFNYLSSNEIIYSFFYLSERLQNLVVKQKNYTNYLQIPISNLDFWNKVLLIIGSQIQTLIINIDYLTLSLDLFSNLSSIIISSPYSLIAGQLKLILENKNFQKLHTLKIKDVVSSKRLFNENELDDEQILFKKIFSNENTLHIFEYFPSLGSLHWRKLEELKFNIHIRSLTLNLTQFKDIFTLIKYTLNLNYLNIQTEPPYLEEEQYEWSYSTRIELNKFYLKFKPEKIGPRGCYSHEIDFDQLFHAIQIFSSSLEILSLNFIHLNKHKDEDLLFNGTKLENRLLKSMIKLNKFYFYACKHINKGDIYNILLTFKNQFWYDHNWFIGIHQNKQTDYAFIYSLPFQFNELKDFTDFSDTLTNNDQILKANPRLWYKITSIELTNINKIDIKNLFPLLKVNMPKLLSITFKDNNHHYSNSFVIDNEIDHIDVTLNNVTTVHLNNISMEKLKQCLIYVLPNLKHLVLHHSQLPPADSELALIFKKRIQQIETDEFFLGEEKIGEKDFTYLSNLQILQITCNITGNNEWLENRSNMIMKLLTNLPKLKTLSIYAIPCSGCFIYGPDAIFNPIIDKLNINWIKNIYEMKYSGQYLRFVRK